MRTIAFWIMVIVLLMLGTGVVLVIAELRALSSLHGPL
jgi:hypothetical protein